eukprot:scaffold245652_cov29-Tisochrysis_lutea.AAC.1
MHIARDALCALITVSATPNPLLQPAEATPPRCELAACCAVSLPAPPKRMSEAGLSSWISLVEIVR